MCILSFFLRAAVTAFSIVVCFGAEDGNKIEFKDCADELNTQTLCYQDFLLFCDGCNIAGDVEFGNRTIQADCEADTTEFCEIADCCPQCFAETQQALTCVYSYSDDDGDTYSEVCNTECSCTDETIDGTPWHDSGGVNFTCAWYSLDAKLRCERFGNRNDNDGFTANTACCECKKLLNSGATLPMYTICSAIGLGLLFLL